MSDSNEAAPTDWARYLREAIERPGWSIARLARESGIDRTTIFRWMKGGGDRITVDSVRRVADAIGDDPDRALRAAAGLPIDYDARHEDEDDLELEVRLIEASDLPEAQIKAMVAAAREQQRRNREALTRLHEQNREALTRLREQQRAQLRATVKALLNVARGDGGAATT